MQKGVAFANPYWNSAHPRRLNWLFENLTVLLYLLSVLELSVEISLYTERIPIP